MRVSVGLPYDRTPPEAWVRTLQTIAPPSEHLSWLKLVWEPGEAWQPIGRWMLWHMRPRKVLFPAHDEGLYADLRRELEGPHPRSQGHWCAPGWCQCAKQKRAWVGGPCAMIDRLTWELYRETGCYGQRWWTIQGTKGGHRHKLTATEQRVFHLATGTKTTPAPGDLPYAEFDQRTVRAVLSFDKVRMWTRVSDFATRHADQLDAEEQAEAEAANRALAQWIDAQVEEGWDAFGSPFRRALTAADRRVQTTDRTDYEAAEHTLVTTY
jgi:hypothetical protein